VVLVNRIVLSGLAGLGFIIAGLGFIIAGLGFIIAGLGFIICLGVLVSSSVTGSMSYM